MSDKKCNFCGRKGVLIYPVRYALASPQGAKGVIGLSGNFKIENAPSTVASAKYTLRPLRPGYLYTYDEKRKLLKGYLVMPAGYLLNFPIRYSPPAQGIVPFHCLDPAEIAISHCVDIEHAPGDLATNLWIGWSNVGWTDALAARISDRAWRKMHMQCIDVAAMLAGRAMHSAEFSRHYPQIASFGAEPAALKLAFDFSNVPAEDEAHMRELAPSMAAIMSAQAPWHQGFIVAVNDPVGITNDLSELLLPTAAAGFDENLYRGKIVSVLIDNAKQAVQQQAREEFEFDEQMAKAGAEIPDGDIYTSAKNTWKVIKAGGIANYERQQERDRIQFGKDQEGRKEAAASHAWMDVTVSDNVPQLDQARLDAFPEQYEQAVEAFKLTLTALIRAHVAWLTSPQLADWMAAVHDDQDLLSGHAYSESFAQCVGMAACNIPCSDQLRRWLDSGDLADRNNLYGRALVFNQKELIDLTEPHLKGSDLRLGNILSVYKGALARMNNDEAAAMIDRLALTTGNILIDAFQTTASASMRAMAVVHLTLLGRSAIKATSLSPNEFAKWMVAQVKSQNIELDSNKKTTSATAYRLAREATRNNAGNAAVIAYELDTAQLISEGRLTADGIKTVRIPGVELGRKWLGSSNAQEFNLGIVTSILQLIALRYAVQNLNNSDHFNRVETQVKTLIAAVNLSANIVGTIAKTVSKAATHPLAIYVRKQWRGFAESSQKIAGQAKLVAVIAGVLGSAFDFINAFSADKQNDKLLRNLYIANGFLSIAVSCSAYIISSFFWPLFIISFFLAIIIILIKKTDLQKWISRCYFSINCSKLSHAASLTSYITVEEELSSYSCALGI